MHAISAHNRFAKKPERRSRIGVTRGQALVFFVVFSLFFYFLTELVFASESASVVPVKEVTVQPGDSLWKIAVQYQDEAGMEVRELVYAIKKMNRLDNSNIYPGQRLAVPVGE
ncbi:MULTISPECIES: cell division suppressor protein YneA [Brevibacillus]|jgi:hypothetical protein|uniref:cell division suppressor protein YneA n=1 Tax=Brevibacillus TaxID=55080 RepID=UPI00040AE1B9|nr:MULTISPECIES: LysM peptidoglycan-binding domain-containing protein [Brevibacillus]TRY25124.1 LysM peptidoglycan-binding domain-containing protein [Brevibacillus sp. LEMMJ03]UYZ11469.1 LysM peptidoglycan-binding domain-containing protein [Brevibacillus sp. WF146]